MVPYGRGVSANESIAAFKYSHSERRIRSESLRKSRRAAGLNSILYTSVYLSFDFVPWDICAFFQSHI